MDPIEHFNLVLAASMTVHQAARRYCRGVRTIRRWCEQERISVRIAGGKRLLSKPLTDLYAYGARGALADFLDGKEATPTVHDAFEQHGLSELLAKIERKKLRVAASNLLALPGHRRSS